ncbi:MAG: ATP synthase F1 subunit delta, partial [Saprospiraceae bacterium]|nr:ATP synthase F1 subunit delta [Saprospiraceae bacterium]
LIYEGKIGKTTLAFFEIILKKGREMYLPEIASDFISQFKSFNRISTVTVTSAAPLNSSSLNEIKSKLLSSGITMDQLDIITKVDPKLIGGFVIEVGDNSYDDSVIHKLNLIKKEFIGNQYVKTF